MRMLLRVVVVMKVGERTSGSRRCRRRRRHLTGTSHPRRGEEGGQRDGRMEW